MKTPTLYIVFLSSIVSGHSASALDLFESYQLALQRDPSFKAQSFDHLASQQQVRIARAALLPSLSAGYNLVRNRDEVNAPDVPFITQGSARYASDEYNINFSQPIYNRGNLVGYRLAKTQARLGTLVYQTARQQLALTVSERYFAVLSARDSLQLAEAEHLAVTRQHDLAKERLEVGLGTKTDLYEALARLRLAEAEVITAANTVQDTRGALEELIGKFDSSLAGLGDTVNLPTPQPADPEHWRAQARLHSLTIKQADATVSAAEQALDLSRAGHWPSLNVIINHANNDADGSISGPGAERAATDALLQLTLPILAGGGVSARVQQDEHRLQAAQQRAQSARHSVHRQVRSAYQNVSASRHRSAALRQAVTASESALEAKQEGFNAGLNTNLDVLDAQRELFRAQRDFLQARYQVVLNLLILRQQSGVLSDQDLNQINKYLHPPAVADQGDTSPTPRPESTTDGSTDTQTAAPPIEIISNPPTAGNDHRIDAWLTLPANQ